MVFIAFFVIDFIFLLLPSLILWFIISTVSIETGLQPQWVPLCVVYWLLRLTRFVSVILLISDGPFLLIDLGGCDSARLPPTTSHQRQKTVTAHLTSRQLLSFSLTRRLSAPRGAAPVPDFPSSLFLSLLPGQPTQQLPTHAKQPFPAFLAWTAVDSLSTAAHCKHTSRCAMNNSQLRTWWKAQWLLHTPCHKETAPAPEPHGWFQSGWKNRGVREGRDGWQPSLISRHRIHWTRHWPAAAAAQSPAAAPDCSCCGRSNCDPVQSPAKTISPEW